MRCADDRGYAMAALLVGMTVMSIMLSMALPTWRTATIREREAELVFRGEQYAHAIELYSRRTGAYPPSLDVLEKGRFIRKLYKDPVNGNTDFQPVYLGQAVPGQPVVPGQAGRGVQGGTSAGGLGQALATQGRGGLTEGQPPASGIGQPAGTAQGQPGGIGVGASAPIIGVVSKSTQESMRLYNGRGRYSEWAFVAVATATQAGGGGRGQGPPGAPEGQGTGTGVGGRGRGRGGRGTEQGTPGRGGPGRFGPGRGGLPADGGPPAGRGNPFGLPSGMPPAGGQPRGRGPAPNP